MTGGVELGGNKVQKLKFLLVDALEQGCNSVVIIGGKQSNHCRTTACAARALGLEPHLWQAVKSLSYHRMRGSCLRTRTSFHYSNER